MSRIRTYSELSLLNTFEERFEYLRLGGSVGKDTFGFDRYLNQIFYNSDVWKEARRKVIIRDGGKDLGVDGYEIPDIRDKNGKIITRALIHHMNPISVEDIVNRNPDIVNPEFLILVSSRTHLAIHYSDLEMLPQAPIIRKPNDTCPWRK